MDDDTTEPSQDGGATTDPDGVRAGGSAANGGGVKKATGRTQRRSSVPQLLGVLGVLLALIAILLGQAWHYGTRVDERDLEIARLRQEALDRGKPGGTQGQNGGPVVPSIPDSDVAIVGPAQPHRPATVGDHDRKIRFTRVPRTGAGSDPQEHIAGEVTGRSVPDGCQVVLYAYVEDTWYVQPMEVEPMTDVEQGRWSNTTHLGTRYAALLVEPSYVPQALVAALPPVGGKVLAVAVMAAGQVPE